MKITEQQLLMLYEIVVAGLGIIGTQAFSQEERQKLINKILNQQDNIKLIDIE